jgi:mRNA interferase MazF
MVARKLARGQVWAVSEESEVEFEPPIHAQSSLQQPGERGRPALVIQTDILNAAGHATTIVIPGTTQTYRDAQGDGFPLRVPVGQLGAHQAETDLLVDQIRALANWRFMGDQPLATLSPLQMQRVQEALNILTGP